MNKEKFLGGIFATAAAVSCCTEMYAFAVDAPSDIELRIGNVTISTEELNGEMIVSVPVTIQNNPGFVELGFLVELDSRLNFEDYNAIESSAYGFGNINVGTMNGWNNTIEVNGYANNVRKFEENGQIAELHIVIPDGIQTGIYPISLLSECGSSKMGIILENFGDSTFGSESFSVLESGSITIKAPDAPPPPPLENPPQSYEPAPEPQNDGNDGKTETQVQTSVSAAVTSSAASSAVSVTQKTTLEKTTSSATETTSTETTVTTEKETKESSTSSTTVKSENNEDKPNSKMLIPIIAATAIVIAAAVGIMVKKKGVK